MRNHNYAEILQTLTNEDAKHTMAGNIFIRFVSIQREIGLRIETIAAARTIESVEH